MAILRQVEQAAAVTLLAAELNALANSANSAPSAEFDNSAGVAGWDGYVRGKVEAFLAAYSGTPLASSGIAVWFLRTADGTNYEDGSASVTPVRPPDVFLQVRAVATGPQRVVRECWVPAGKFKAMARNEQLGFALAAAGNTVKVRLSTDQVS